MMSGPFIDFYLPYKTPVGTTLSATDQAISILQEAEKLLAIPVAGAAITYSANYGQTVTINDTYAGGGWNTGTSGVNQAMVMSAMETLQSKPPWSKLQKKVRIAPITTMTYSDYGGKTHDEVIADDLANIKALLDSGWAVLGWINHNNKPVSYAVGGGAAGTQFTPAQSATVQAALKGFAKNYPSQ